MLWCYYFGECYFSIILNISIFLGVCYITSFLLGAGNKSHLPDKHSAKQMHPQPIEEGPLACISPTFFVLLCTSFSYHHHLGHHSCLLLSSSEICLMNGSMYLSQEWVYHQLSSAPSFSYSCFVAFSFNMDDMVRNSFQMHAILKMPGLKNVTIICDLYKVPLLDIWKMSWDWTWGSTWGRFTGTGTDSERRGLDLVHTDLQLPSLWNVPGIKPLHDVTTTETFQNSVKSSGYLFCK